MDTQDPEKLEKRARNVLLFQLGRSMKTRKQLAAIMVKREIPAEVFEPILDRFQEAQLIDDAAYAKAFVASRLACGGKSSAMLKRELKQKGVPDEQISEALSELDSEREIEIAVSLAKKRLATLRNLEPEVKRRRVLGYLQRRGFSSSDCSRALALASASE